MAAGADRDRSNRVRFSDGAEVAEVTLISSEDPPVSPRSTFNNSARPRSSSLKRGASGGGEGSSGTGGSTLFDSPPLGPSNDPSVKPQRSRAATVRIGGSAASDSPPSMPATPPIAAASSQPLSSTPPTQRGDESGADTALATAEDLAAGLDYSALFGERVSREAHSEEVSSASADKRRGSSYGASVDEIETSWLLSNAQRSLPVVQKITLLPGLNKKFNNLCGRVIFFRPRVFRKSSGGSYVERVVFIVPTGALHLCDRAAVPKRSIALQAVSSFAIHENCIAIIFDNANVHDIQLRFDAEKDYNLPSLKQFVTILRHFNPDASITKGIVGGLGKLDIQLKKPASFVPPGRIAVLSVPQGEEVPGLGSGSGGGAGGGSALGSDTPAMPNARLDVSRNDTPHRASFLLPTVSLDDDFEFEANTDARNSSDDDYDGDQGAEAPRFSYKTAQRSMTFRSATSAAEHADLRATLEAGGVTTVQESPRAEIQRDADEDDKFSAVTALPDFALEPSRAANASSLSAASELTTHSPSPNVTDVRVPLAQPNFSGNAALFAAEVKIEDANQTLLSELRRVDESIMSIRNACAAAPSGIGLQLRAPFGGAAPPATAPRPPSVMTASAGYHRTIVLSTLICDICRRQRLAHVPMAQKELLLPTKTKAKNVINYI